MAITAVLPFVHQLLRAHLHEGGVALDGTMGNGNDTLLLAQCVGASGRVYAFDVQTAALAATRARLQAAGAAEQVKLLLCSHEYITGQVAEPLDAAVFNFGYLPRGDKNLTTQPETSVAALQQTLALLKNGGIAVAAVYPGHETGKSEAQALLDFARSLPQQQFAVLQYGFINQKNCPPFVLAFEKKAYYGRNVSAD